MILPLLVLSLAAQDPAPAPAAGAAFEVPGVFAVDTPEGFAWRRVRVGEVNGVKMQTYACIKDDTAARAVITVEGRLPDGEPGRVAAVKGHWNGLVETLQRNGFKDPETRSPAVEPPIPDRVEYGVVARDARGVRQDMRCVTVFGAKNTYILQAISPDPEQVDALYRAVASFRELP